MKKATLVMMKTPFGENLSDKPLSEYPRPQFQRKSYVNLNGWWNYAFNSSDALSDNFDGKILVPFSPETTLSGVCRALKKDEFLHYQTTFVFHSEFENGRTLLHFGAVDCIAVVYVNKKKVGSHVGGYNAFSFDVSDFLVDGENVLDVVVRDETDTSFYTNGKQSSKRGGMWYTPQSGIWQTVWFEQVAQNHIKDVTILPDVDKSVVCFEFDCSREGEVDVEISLGGKFVFSGKTQHKKIECKIDDAKLWSPEQPTLYDVAFTFGEDKVKSYFAMRKISVAVVDGVKRVLLNNQPYFQNGLLDQGYWSDGLYTAPDDKSMIFDISTAKRLGYNMLRKHIKVEPMRWYFHCDRLGMLVWQDMPSGGTAQNLWLTLRLPFLMKWQSMSDTKNYRRFSRGEEQSRKEYCSELDEMLAQLKNCPCIVVWVPFNEGWGQFDSAEIAEHIKAADGQRLVDHASGWHDQGAGDFLSLHVYFRKVKIPSRDKKGRAIVLSEFGGYSFCEKGHSFNPDNVYGYGSDKITNAALLTDALENLYVNQVVPCIKQGLCAAVYTQLSDVEDETNGLLTYDRKIVKVDEQRLKDINAKVKI